MVLMPKRVKYRKSQRGRMSGVSTGGGTINFGEFGLKSLEELPKMEEFGRTVAGVNAEAENESQSTA